MKRNVALNHFASFNFTDAPEIELERPFVHTGVGFETQLICIVHAEPSPQIVWYKGSTQLGITEQHSQQVCMCNGTLHFIYISYLRYDDCDDIMVELRAYILTV